MPIDASSLLARLSPIAPINITPGGGGGGSMERERLRLMREQFEESKRQNRQNAELERLRIQSQLAQQQLIGERERQEAERQAAAKRLELKRAGALEFSKLAGSGDIEGARALVPYLASVGQGVELLGEEGGMPSFRMFDLDDQGNEAQAPEQGIGYPTDESGSLDVPAGIPSTEEAFGRALGASQHFAETGQPLRGPDEPDYTGGVPRNVIDTGAMASATAARLNPALAGLVGAYPEPYQESALSTAKAVSGMGLPALKALDQFKALRTGADSLISSEIDAAAQQGRFEQTQRVAASNEAEDRYKTGFTTLGDQIASDFGIGGDLVEAQEKTIEAIDKLRNSDPYDDEQVLALISRRGGERGATTEPDIKRVTGQSQKSLLKQAYDWLEKNARLPNEKDRGLPLDQRNTLIKVLEEMQRSDAGRYAKFRDAMQAAIDDPETDANVARGLRARLKYSVPKKYRDQWEEEAKEKRAENDAGFDAELDAVSRASNLDPDKVRGIIAPESGGNAQAVNPQSGASGLIQFLPKVAESLGSTIDEIRKMTAEEQLPLVMKYLSDRGITKDSSPGDYYMAVAAPAFIGKPDSAVVYKKGSKEWEQNPAWRPADGGDITVGSIKAYGAKGAAKKSKPAPPSKADSEALDILNRSGY